RSRRSPSCSWTPPGWRRSPTTSGQGSKRTRRASTARAAAVLAVVLASVLAGCGNPPQVVDISPSRGAADVHSGDPVRVRFDRPMDRASVASRFHLVPSAPGRLRWLSDRELAYEHAPLRASTRYTVALDAGYRDAGGNVETLRHSWSFRTEGAPVLSGASPGPDDGDVDPASYITLTFSRQMDLTTLQSAVSLAPSAPFAIRQDPLDPRRVVLAPGSLLEPEPDYSVTV